MAQAKGVLPTIGDDREVLYKNRDMVAHFIGIKLPDGMTAEQIHDWIAVVDAGVERLSSRDSSEVAQHPDGRKVAAVAAGFAPSFFAKMNAAGLSIDQPSAFVADSWPVGDSWIPGVTPLDVDALFYVASTRQTRVNEFLAAIAAGPGIAVLLERGYQRADETEPFGYRDGVRNVERSQRFDTVFVDTDNRHPDEPDWAHGGTYMVTMKIRQHPAAFAALDEPARDAVVGRTKDGTRLDLVGSGVEPKHEGPEEVTGLPPTSHVRKSGPRGNFDDNQVFRRGLPFMDVANGAIEVGLHFCSFQATLAQFDTVFSDWMLNQRFPAPGAGADALMNPSNGFTTIVHGGTFFGPPTRPGGLREVFAQRPEVPSASGRLVVNKVVTSDAEPGLRFRRNGFRFHVEGPDGAVVPESDFVTSSNGRGVCPVELDLHVPYVLVETESPTEVQVSLVRVPFTLVKRRTVLKVLNQVTVPSTGGY